MVITAKMTRKVLIWAGIVQVVALFLIAAPTALAAGAREYENPPCYDITGSTQPLLVGGVNNGGLMDFDEAGVAPAQQACVRMSSSLPGMVPVRVEGWVWNSNLGWVSLYCPGGVGAKNLDIDCGSQAYGVTFTPSGGTAPDFASVTMSGYAWGDNIGWISFNSGFHQMKPTASGANRGLIQASNPAVDRHTWSDSIGWMDWSSVWFHWEDTDPPMTDPDVLKYISVCSSKDPLVPVLITDPKCTCDLDGTCPIITTEAKIPDANGTDKYMIEIPFVDGGAKVPDTGIEECAATSVNMMQTTVGGKPYCARIELTWEDAVDYDQTTAASQNQAANPYAANNNGATRKPLLYNLFGGVAPNFVYSGGSTLWGANVISYAPTSDRNMSSDGMENEKFYYATFDGTLIPDSAGYDITKTGQNLLKLKELKLLFFKYSTGPGVPGECIYGNVNVSQCEMRNYMVSGGTTLSFNGLGKTDTLTYRQDGKELNFINVTSPDNALTFHYKGVPKVGFTPGTMKIEGFTGLQDSSVYRLKLINPPFPEDTESEASPYFQDLGGSSDTDWLGQLFSDTPGQTLSANAGPFFYSKVSYAVPGAPAGPTYTKYFSTKLPRIKAGLLLNPVAKIQGNVYVTDFGQKASDVSLRSLGNISSNLRREAIVRNVAKYLSGYTAAISPGNKTVTTGTATAIAGLNELVTDKVFYVKDGDLTINCGATCTFDKNVTFIVENGDIFVNSNILSSTGNTQVGLIAIRNLEGNVKNQGFLYLDQDVTWLQNVQVYLDRVVQSYDSGVAVTADANGFVKYGGDDYARQAMFRNQVVIEGTISSMNGIGNASRNPATDENGEAAGGTTYCSTYNPGGSLSGICRARLVDLNYLRYYGPGLEICTGLEGAGAVANVPRDQATRTNAAAGFGCNPAAAGYDIDASNLFSVDANTDLIPSGGGGTRSQYFVSKGLPVTLANEFPVNFYYKAIAKDLAGFEVDQAVDPLLQN